MWMTKMWVLLISVCSDGNCVPQYQEGFISRHYCEKAAAPLVEILRDHGQRDVKITVTTQCIVAVPPREV